MARRYVWKGELDMRVMGSSKLRAPTVVILALAAVAVAIVPVASQAVAAAG